MKIVIVGAGGQLGKALRTKFPDAIATTRETLDVTDSVAMEAYDWSRVDTIINAAAYTNVDGAESAEGRAAAWQINAQAVANLAKIAVQHDLTLAHVSSEYVFDGTKSPHAEDELVTPLGVYAQTKAAGDIAVGVAPRHYIVRVSWLIGDGANFVRTMMGLANKNISPSVVADQIGRLTFTGQVADGIEHLLNTKATYGVYNLSNEGEPAAWSEVTRAIYRELGRDDLTVTDVTTAEYFKDKPAAAPRPLQSTLDLGKIKSTGLVVRDWRKDLAAYISQQ